MLWIELFLCTTLGGTSVGRLLEALDVHMANRRGDAPIIIEGKSDHLFLFFGLNFVGEHTSLQQQFNKLW